MTKFGKLLCAFMLLLAAHSVSGSNALEVALRVNDYFMRQNPDPTVPTFVRRERPSNLWTRAVYYEGLMDLYDLCPRQEYWDYAYRWGAFHDWKPRNGNRTHNADDQCCLQTYIDMYERTGDRRMIHNAIENIDMVCQRGNGDWWWIDAVQMAMPVFTRLYRVTGEQRYLDKAWMMYNHTRDTIGERGMYNSAAGLWWRDADFDGEYREPNGRQCYWSRGNGWVMAALVRVLADLPADDKHRRDYVADLKAMSRALKLCQREDGFWNVSLHDESNFGGKETTGTALFVYGMAWAVRNGLLSRAEYLPVIEKAWNAIATEAIHEDGYIGYVQGTGKSPKDGQPVTYDSHPDFEDYGTGCVLLAACEMHRLEQTLLWPEPAAEAKPFSRWWWMGSAVDSINLDYLLDEYSNTGIGGLEITPIYGVQGNDANEIPFLSERWMKMLSFLNRKGREAGIKIDMNTGTGWPFGGPEVSEEDAACRVVFDADGHLQIGRTRQKVKRAAPGGEGWVLDHFNRGAVDRYLERFTRAFESSGADYPHNFFNDSYEVYGADWTPSLMSEFKKRRGYDLADYGDLLRRVLAGKGKTNDEEQRIISDYRQTLGELLLENFTRTWTDWAHSHGSFTRNQAHGSPGNLIDIYAAVDIPECEGFGLSQFGIKGLRQDSLVRKNYSDLSMLKYASSAAHIAGKPLVSAESFTWLTEHFRTSLSQCKPEIDLFMTAGVNHLYFHGTTYSPREAAWPGWKFYASVDMSPTNSIWRDAPAMMDYITRCQSFMQWGEPDNDFLVYLPIYDMWQENGGGLLMFDIHKMASLAPRFIESVNRIVGSGYDCDYTSDAFVMGLSVANGILRTEAGTRYKALVVPGVRLMPHDVVAKLLGLARKGAKIVFLDRYPEDVPGYGRLKERRKAFKRTMAKLPKHSFTTLDAVGVKAEEMKSRYGLSAIRRKNPTGYHYFVSSLQDRGVDEWVSLAVPASDVLLFDPMDGSVKRAMTRQHDGATQVRLHLVSGQSCILQTFNRPVSVAVPDDVVYEETGESVLLDSGWSITFPSLMRSVETGKPCPWTALGDAQLDSLAGTGVYHTEFELKDAEGEWMLDLGDVRESARVRINGRDAGTLWAVPFRTLVGRYLHPGRNTIDVEVTCLPANRIAAMDQRGIPWRRFKEINLVDLNYKAAGYGHWQLMESGLNSTPRLLRLAAGCH